MRLMNNSKNKLNSEIIFIFNSNPTARQQDQFLDGFYYLICTPDLLSYCDMLVVRKIELFQCIPDLVFITYKKKKKKKDLVFIGVLCHFCNFRFRSEIFQQTSLESYKYIIIEYAHRPQQTGIKVYATSTNSYQSNGLFVWILGILVLVLGSQFKQQMMVYLDVQLSHICLFR